ncbi:MAG TPA: hypothetical protein VK806_07915 [Bacteroidia bacterium]|nr:hypothetical protein [Bacteroidia bacterium]
MKAVEFTVKVWITSIIGGGVIWGIFGLIKAFSSDTRSYIKDVSDMALLFTFFGLFVSIPALIIALIINHYIFAFELPAIVTKLAICIVVGLLAFGSLNTFMNMVEERPIFTAQDMNFNLVLIAPNLIAAFIAILFYKLKPVEHGGN